jgi:hypothetical protein
MQFLSGKRMSTLLPNTNGMAENIIVIFGWGFVRAIE